MSAAAGWKINVTGSHRSSASTAPPSQHRLIRGFASVLKSTFATFRSIFQARSAASKALQLALLVHDRCVLFAAYLQVDFTARTYKLPCTHALESFGRVCCAMRENILVGSDMALLTCRCWMVWLHTSLTFALPSHPSDQKDCALTFSSHIKKNATLPCCGRL